MELHSLVQGAVLRYVLEFFIAVLLIWWLRLRSGSNHVFFSRLWSIAQGKPQAGDRTLRLFLARRGTLMQFRTVTGVKSRTIAQSHRLLKWTEEHDEEIGDVARCGNYFDLEAPGLKDDRPKRWQFFLAIPFIALCAFALVFVVGLSASGRAWVSVKNGSGAQLLLSPTNIEVHKTHQYFSKDDCRNQDHASIAKQVGIPVNEIDTACGWFKDDAALKGEIDQTVTQQRALAAVLAILIIAYGLPPYRWLTSAMAAIDMRGRLEKSKERSSDAREMRQIANQDFEESETDPP